MAEHGLLFRGFVIVEFRMVEIDMRAVGSDHRYCG